MNKSLIAVSTLALVLGTSAAVAQERGGTEKSAPKTQQSAPAGAMHNGAAERSEPTQRSEPRAQENRSRSETTGQAPSSREQGEKQQGREEKGRDEKRQTTGQAPTERREQTRENDQKRNEGRAEERNEKTDRANSRETTGQGAASSRSSVNISSENRTKIHDIIVKERSAPRVEHVDFDVSVGTVVPKSVRLVAVPSTIVTIEPSWRGYEYFLVGDEIIIVNPRSMEIVAVLDA
jgi:hypothetical protein